MAYVKQEWKGYPDTSTPITADRLNHMEDGIYSSGVPDGGTTGQVLAKKSDTNNDVEWVDQIYTKDDFKVIKTSVTANQDSNKQGYTIIDLPTGFNYENTVVISVTYSQYDNYSYSILAGSWCSSNTSAGTMSELVVNIGDSSFIATDPDNCLKLEYFPRSSSKYGSTIYVTVVLMKIE